MTCGDNTQAFNALGYLDSIIICTDTHDRVPKYSYTEMFVDSYEALRPPRLVRRLLSKKSTST